MEEKKQVSHETYIWDEGFPRPDLTVRTYIFVCSCIEAAAKAVGCKPSEMYRRMKAVDLIHDYIVKCYDVLHTESRENVTADVVSTLKDWEIRKGVGKNG